MSTADDDYQSTKNRKIRRVSGLIHHPAYVWKSLQYATEAPKTLDDVKKKFFQTNVDGSVSKELTTEFAALQTSSMGLREDKQR